jgi:hypothetical protein
MITSGVVEGKQLWYWYRDNSNVDLSWTPDNSNTRLPWIRGQRVTGEQDDVAGPGCIIQSVSSTGQRGNFEVVVPLRHATGAVELRHFYRDNSDVHLPSPLRQRLTMTVHVPWMRGQGITGERECGRTRLHHPIQFQYRAAQQIRSRRAGLAVPLGSLSASTRVNTRPGGRLPGWAAGGRHHSCLGVASRGDRVSRTSTARALRGIELLHRHGVFYRCGG